MGVVEWIAIATLALGLAGHIIKAYQDHAITLEKLRALENWRCKMEKLDLLTETDHSKDKYACRTEIYKDISRLESRFEKFLESQEVMKRDMGEVKEKQVKILTILENKYLNGNSNIL